MLKDFREFIAKGNVLDLAVAVIIGAAFAKIVTSLTDDIIMPIVGKIFGGLDFSSHFMLLGPVPADYHGSMTDYAALKKAGAPVLGWGAFVTEIVSFVILAFIIFLMVRWATKAMRSARWSSRRRAERGRAAGRDPGRAEEARVGFFEDDHAWASFVGVRTSRHRGSRRWYLANFGIATSTRSYCGDSPRNCHHAYICLSLRSSEV